MLDVAITVFGVALTALLVGVAGLLRRVTDVKLGLGGYSSNVSQFMIDIGSPLPPRLLAEVPDPSENALILLGTDSCATCRRLLEELDAVTGQVLVGIAGYNGSNGNGVSDRAIRVLSADAVEEFVAEFNVSQLPLAVVQRRGHVIGAAYGADIATGERLGNFWSTFGKQVKEVTA